MASFLSVVRVLLLSFLISSTVAATACQNPKVRREWRQLSTSERTEWIEAVNCLATLPHDPKLTPSVPTNLSLIPPVDPNTSFYDDLVYMHMDLNVNIHYTGRFYPWHRYFVQFFEDSLVQQCGYNGATPYWDWTLDSSDMFNSAFFDNSSSGVGGWGDPANDYQIYTGGFKDVIRAYPNPHHIRRNFSYMPFSNPDYFTSFVVDPTAPLPPTNAMINTTMTKENVDTLVSSYDGDFVGFQAYSESPKGIHGGAHLIIAADMTGYCPHDVIPPSCYPGPKWTPNDPLFFMHHAMVDKIWYDWQHASPNNTNAYGGGSVSTNNNYTLFTQFPTGLPPNLNLDSPVPGDGFWDVTIRDVMNTTGDLLCYTYA